MAFNLDQELFLKGIGKGFFDTVTGKFIEVISGQNLKLDVNATLEDVFGGDGLFPKYTFVSKKEGTIEIDTATFTASQIGLSQGVEYNTTTAKRMQRVLKTKSDTSLGENLTGVSDVICLDSTGTKVAVTLGGTPDDAGVDVSATGELTWGDSAATGEYVFWFKSDATNAVQATMLKNAMPEVAAFSWMFTPEDENGAKYQIDIYARRVRSDGKFTLDTSRDKASVQKLTVKILDPGDGKDDFAVITITKLA